MRKEQQIIQQKSTKMRQRISSRNHNLTDILVSVGLAAGATPSLDLLRKTVARLESRKKDADITLSTILNGDAFCYAQELEADLITDFEEYQRLLDCLEEVREYHEVICSDFAAAHARLRSDAESVDLKDIRRDIGAIERELNEIRNMRDLSADSELSPEEIRGRIAQIRQTLSAEQCSAATAVEIETTSAGKLRDLQRSALIRLEQAMRRQVV
jgi:hypothetical protein